MNVTVPDEVQPAMHAMQVTYPYVDTDGMQYSGDSLRAANAFADRSAAGAGTELARTIGMDGHPAGYAGDGARALGDRTLLIDTLTAEVSAAMKKMPDVFEGVARAVKDSQTALIMTAAATALAVYSAYMLGGVTGSARAEMELLKGRQKWGLILREAGQGTNRTLAEIFDRLVTRPLQKALQDLRLPRPPLAPAGPNGFAQEAATSGRAGNFAKSLGKDEKEAGRANMGVFRKGEEDPWAGKDTTSSGDNVPTQHVTSEGEPWNESEERVEPLDQD